MAEEHNALKYGPLISKAASIAAGGGYGEVGISRLSETLTPTIDLWSRPEWALLRGERHWMVRPSNIATVAEFTQVGIRNPTGSRMLVVVQWIQVVPVSNEKFSVKYAASSAVDATSTPNSLDTRTSLLAGISTVSLANSAAAALGANLASWSRLSGDSGEPLRLDLVLSPGFDVYVGIDVTNRAIEATFRGYERMAFPGELQTNG